MLHEMRMRHMLQHRFYLNSNKSFLNDQITIDEPSNNKKKRKGKKIKRLRHEYGLIFLI